MEMKMKTYGFDFGNHQNEGKIFEFKSRRHAASYGNGLLVVTSVDDIIGSSVTRQQMVMLYNQFLDKEPIKGFRDKATAAKALMALAQAKAVSMIEKESENPMSDVAEEVKVVAPKKAKVVKAAKAEAAEGNGRRGRNSMFDGRKFKAKDGLTTNPRRAGTNGFISFEILLANPEGLQYEDYLAAGGRRVDLAWDLAHDNVAVI
jgi:hypothetical protein